MALTLNKTGITTGETVEAYHVTQSIDAFSGLEAYDITLSGSLTLQNGTEGADRVAVSNGFGEINFTDSITASLQGTASYADSASYANSASYALTASYISNAVSTSYAPNFANTDLIFDANRTHNTDGNTLEITTDGGGYNESWFYQEPSGISLGYQYSQLVIEDAAGQTLIGFRTGSNGNDYIFLITGSNVVINESGENVDFRIEGDTNTNLLFTDASTNRVGIGKNTPNTILDISGSTTISGSLITSGSRVRNYRTITVSDANWSANPTQEILNTDNIVLVIDNTTTPPASGDGNINIVNFLNTSPPGTCVEIVCIKAGTGGVVLKGSTTMAGNFLYINAASTANATVAIGDAVGESVTLMAYGQANSGSVWGNGYL
jgi:hypothetical protein